MERLGRTFTRQSFARTRGEDIKVVLVTLVNKWKTPRPVHNLLVSLPARGSFLDRTRFALAFPDLNPREFMQAMG